MQHLKYLFLFVLILTSCNNKKSETIMKSFFPEVSKYSDYRISEFSQIPQERKIKLEKISSFVKENLDTKQVNLIFICTHNSRRSHISQIWAQVAANYYCFNNVFTYSGGTESTAFNPRAVRALRKTGLKIEKTNEENNPLYLVTFSSEFESIKAFSKKFSHEMNPQDGFCAIMTCSQADEACPYVPGARERVAIPYDDPKAFDGTDLEESKYDERCQQISREMFYIFSKVNSILPENKI
jgi:protein-tyrosine-phosphatase